MSEYDITYASTPDVFGIEPEPILFEHLNAIDPSRPVLDIGAGQGRHAFALAERGFTVHALDPSEVAIAQISQVAQVSYPGIIPVCSDIFAYNPAPSSYSGILLFGLLQILSRDQIYGLIARINAWLVPGGLLFLTAFGAAETKKHHEGDGWCKLDGYAYSNDSGEYRTYLRSGEILTLFPGYTVVVHREGPGSIHHHGDGIDEQHAMVEAVLVR